LGTSLLWCVSFVCFPSKIFSSKISRFLRYLVDAVYQWVTLNSAGEGGIYPSNLMDPVMNRIDGGKIEIIKTLGKLKYTPATKELLPLLETDNEYLFELTIEVLNQLGSKDYIPYINKHLEEGTRDLILDICFIITENNLEECIPSLMQFVATHDKSVHPSMEYTISKYSGLAHFKTDTVREFLYADFLSVLEMEGGGVIDNKMDWVEEYMEVFVELEIDKAKPHFYDFMFDYFGFDHNFKTDPSLFVKKSMIEDSLINVAQTLLQNDSIEKIEACAYIEKKDNVVELQDYTVRITLNSSNDLVALINKLDEKGLPKDNVIASTGRYTQLFAAKDIKRFGNNLMRSFLIYISSYPDQQDIEFLENLSKYNYPTTDYDKKKLTEYIEKAKENLKK
jgi:hypothetical protein